MKYDRFTRWLHAGLAFGITLQLLLSLAMEPPMPDKTVSGFARVAFDAHANLGIFTLAILIVHWIWQLSGHTPRGLSQLFPWFSADRPAAVLAEIKQLFASRFRDIPLESPLAGSVHGLGILAATVMAASGSVLYFGINENGAMTPPIHTVAEFHSFMATFMWIYLGGHVAMAAVHRWLGHRAISDIFDLKH